jgi:hypothetical protein
MPGSLYGFRHDAEFMIHRHAGSGFVEKCAGCMSSPYQVLVREQSPEWRGTAPGS